MNAVEVKLYNLIQVFSDCMPVIKMFKGFMPTLSLKLLIHALGFVCYIGRFIMVVQHDTFHF